MTDRDYVKIAKQYARDVVRGKILACRYVKLACQRFLDDLKRKGDFPYRLDAARATKVCRFVELLPHVKGKWAASREKIRLEPWQCFIIVNVFAWVSKKTGLRRYRRVYVEVPRKNAKSTLTAALANYMLTADGEHGAEVYCLDPGVPVLCDDLKWRRVGELAVGDGLIAFDENTPVRPATYRKFRRASVTSVARIVRPSYRVTFADGGSVIASAEHKWLCKRAPKGDRQDWSQTDQLYPGSRIRYLGAPWQTDESREAGYLAGVYDGEGCVANGLRESAHRTGFRVSVAQRPGIVLDEVKRILTGKGFVFVDRSHAKSGVHALDMQSAYECMRLLGSVRPGRLLAKAPQLYEGRALNRGQCWRDVAAIDYLGERDVVAIETTTRTLIADGLFSHNSGATTEKQAWEVFGPARLMADKTPDLVEAFGVTVGAKNLHVLNTASKFEPIIGKPGDGASPSFSITDEYHEHPTSEQYDTMVTGMGAREQPIAWVITTAGSDTAGPCYALRSQAVESLEAKVDHDELFGLVYTVDDGIDWTSEEALRMANPNMGVSVFADFLRTEQARAVKSPREQSTFKTKHLNVWVTAASPFFNAEQWNRLADPSLSVDDFRGDACVAGLDLASKLDLASTVKVFKREQPSPAGERVCRACRNLRDKMGCTECKGTGRVAFAGGMEEHFYVFANCYIPEARTESAECRHYAQWVAQGRLTATPGNITDYDYIEADLKDDAVRHTILQLGADPHNATQLLTHMQDHLGAAVVVEVPQTVTHLSEPMKEVQALIVDGRIHHDGNPVLAWCIGNVTAQEDRNANVFPRKERPEQKIDAAVALIIAMGRGLAAFEEAGSVYDTRGILEL